MQVFPRVLIGRAAAEIDGMVLPAMGLVTTVPVGSGTRRAAVVVVAPCNDLLKSGTKAAAPRATSSSGKCDASSGT